MDNVIIAPLVTRNPKDHSDEASDNPRAGGKLQKSGHKAQQCLLAPPRPENLKEIFAVASRRFNEIICLFISSQLLDCITVAQQAAVSLGGRAKIQYIDSQTTSIGLGHLVTTAAEAAAKGAPPIEVERLVRGQIARSYTILCTPNLSHLYANGFVDHAQAAIAEMLGLMPLFTIEDGALTPLEKARNQRHTADLFQEFISEFEILHNISFLQSSPANTSVIRLVRDYAQQNHPKTPFTEHHISPSLAALFGPRSMGVFVTEALDF